MSEKLNSSGKVLITGATSGLGREIARALLADGWIVYGTGRTPARPEISNENFRFIYTDFSDFQQTANAIKQTCFENSFNLVINNAGILSPPSPVITRDGFEYTLQVNFLANLLVNEIIIRAGGPNNIPSVISITSPVYRRGSLIRASLDLQNKPGAAYRPFDTYSDSKLLLLQLMAYYSEKYSEGKNTFTGFNPGVFSSGIYRTQKEYFRFLYRLATPFMISPRSVASSLIRVLKDDRVVSGNLYDRKMRLRKIPVPESDYKTLIDDLIMNALRDYL
jgi:NAD(P)-dependent dehydrogenase (short-subunit alcohol dehydrogenase family)